MTGDVLDLTLCEAHAALKKGQLDTVELTSAAIARARQVGEKTNAFLQIRSEPALQQAEKQRHERPEHVLQGIPLAHKDCLAHEGETMTVGARRPRPADTMTATVIARINAHKAIEIGRLHLSEIIAGPSGNNVHFGDCLNAWNTDYISGGSSSGSAVAVASGSVFAALGTDTGGSVRIPAAVNGLFGLKPSFGRVSRYGAFPRSVSSDVIGPLARTAQDCAVMLQAIAGPDPGDSDTLGIAVPNYVTALETAANHTRLGLFRPSDPIDDEVMACFEKTVQMASRQWGGVVDRQFDDWGALYALGDMLSKVEAAQVHAATMASAPESHSKAIYTRTEPGLHLPAIRYMETLQLRPIMLQRFIDQAFADVDVLLLPTLPMPTPRIEDMDMEAGGNVHSLVPRLTCLTRPFSFLGLPALSMPMGLDARGLPMGVQLIGRPYSEARLLAIAHKLSMDVGWSFRPSELARV
ncbi:amidase [Pollutimonas bauzanensis]|uniref:amidase n=1 Tax=Pollutimonas bauzanensis TaxID=658167 RepID=UPI00333F63B3